MLGPLCGGAQTPGSPPTPHICAPPPRFKVFADYEAYVKCQEKVSALYKVGTPPAGTPPKGAAPSALGGWRGSEGGPQNLREVMGGSWGGEWDTEWSQRGQQNVGRDGGVRGGSPKPRRGAGGGTPRPQGGGEGGSPNHGDRRGGAQRGPEGAERGQQDTGGDGRGVQGSPLGVWGDIWGCGPP